MHRGDQRLKDLRAAAGSLRYVLDVGLVSDPEIVQSLPGGKLPAEG